VLDKEGGESGRVYEGPPKSDPLESLISPLQNTEPAQLDWAGDDVSEKFVREW
jgi:hypothetical protein